MFRIARIRIRWINTSQYDSNAALTTLGLLAAWGAQRLIFGSTAWSGSALFAVLALVLLLRARKIADQIAPAPGIPAEEGSPETTPRSPRREFVVPAVLFAVLGILAPANLLFTAINLSAWFAALGLLLLALSAGTDPYTGQRFSKQYALSTSYTTNKMVQSAPLQGLRIFHPRNWRVRVRWIGFGLIDTPLHAAPGTIPTDESIRVSPLFPVLPRFHLPKARVRVRWVGFDSMNWGFLVLLLCILAFARLAYMNQADAVFAVELADRKNLVANEYILNGETIKIFHSQQDMGQVMDLFDRDTFTLLRGLEANPLVLDFEFVNPRPIIGLVMDFGGMDFALYVWVYGDPGSDPTLYEGEYRNQPPEPHVELSFINGPPLVKRIYIEVEQLNPPDEPHIHIREVLFRE